METASEDCKEKQENKHFYSVYTYKKELTLLKTNLLSSKDNDDLQQMLIQKLNKSLVFPGQGSVVSVDFSSQGDGGTKAACYYYLFDRDKPTSTNSGDTIPHAVPVKYLVCFISDHEEALDLFRSDLDRYCLDVIQSQLTSVLEKDITLPPIMESSLKNWHTIAVEYLLRCRQSLQDNLKYLIHSALLDNKLVMSGGTTELQTDIQRFYNACSLSDLLSQLRETRLQQEAGSMSASVDMLVDVDSGQTDTQTTITVSLSADSVKLDFNGCNKFCEEWANALHRPEFQNNPAKQKQVIEAFKLKFIQTMNTLKRLLREADNDYYALYRAYVFLRDSGNSEILLHYVSTEAVLDTASVLKVLQEFIQEQQT